MTQPLFDFYKHNDRDSLTRIFANLEFAQIWLFKVIAKDNVNDFVSYYDIERFTYERFDPKYTASFAAQHSPLERVSIWCDFIGQDFTFDQALFLKQFLWIEITSREIVALEYAQSLKQYVELFEALRRVNVRDRLDMIKSFRDISHMQQIIRIIELRNEAMHNLIVNSIKWKSARCPLRAASVRDEVKKYYHNAASCLFDILESYNYKIDGFAAELDRVQKAAQP